MLYLLWVEKTKPNSLLPVLRCCLLFPHLFGPRTPLCSHGHPNYSSGSTLLHLSAHQCRLKPELYTPATASRHSVGSQLKVLPGSGWCWVMCQSAATSGWCSQEGQEVPGWCRWKELSRAVVVQGPGKQSGAGVGETRGVFQDGCSWFWHSQGNGTLRNRPGKGNEGVRLPSGS